MREYENNGTTENNNFKNNIAASMTTLMINIHISCLVFIFFDFLFFHKVETRDNFNFMAKREDKSGKAKD